MGNNWPFCKLGLIATKIGSGATPLGGQSAYKTSGVSLIRSLNVYDFEFSYKDLAFIDDEQANKLNNVIVQPQDILLNITGASVGRCCLVPENVLPARVNQHVLIIRLDSLKADPFFVLYCLNSPYYKHHLLGLAQGGATREALTKSTIENFEIPVPPLKVQKKIAAVLSAYDELIENNNRRIAILEEMAQNLYQEWCVRFKYLGYEGVPLVESELGLIPAGWEVVNFTNIAEVKSGGTPKTSNSEYWNGHIPFFSPKDISSSFFVFETERYITEAGLKNCNSNLYLPKTVFITARGTVGKIVMPAVPMAMNQSCYALIGLNGVSQYYVFLNISNHVASLKQKAHGAVFDTIIVDTFERLQTLKPTKAVLESFLQVIEPIFDLILNLQQKNIILRQSRDLLLPRLISGELDLSEVEIVGSN